MPISPPAPRLGPVDFDYPHGSDFVPPPHLIKRGGPSVDPSLTPSVDIDTSFDPAEILNTEPIPNVRPIFIGLRRALAARRVEVSNNRLQDLNVKHRVLRSAGRAVLTGGSLPASDRPSTAEEIKASEKLDKINTKRHRAGSRLYSTSHNLSTPARATWAESKHARKSSREHAKRRKELARLDDKFRGVITKPAVESERAIARRNRAVVKLEALDRAAERRAAKIDQMRVNAVQSGRLAVKGTVALGRFYKEAGQNAGKLYVRGGKHVAEQTAEHSQLAAKGTVALGRFYKEAGQNAGKLYVRGGKYVARRTVKHASRVAGKVKSRVRSKKS